MSQSNDHQIRKPINALPYNANYHNGIVITCECCGRDFEETDGGYYPPLEFEDERYTRKCKICKEYNL